MLRNLVTGAAHDRACPTGSDRHAAARTKGVKTLDPSGCSMSPSNLELAYGIRIGDLPFDRHRTFVPLRVLDQVAVRELEHLIAAGRVLRTVCGLDDGGASVRLLA